MSPAHPSDAHAAHEHRLERVLVGDVPPDAAEVDQWRAECRECAGALDGLSRLSRTLDRLGEEEREDVALVAGERADAPAAPAVRAAIERMAAADSGERTDAPSAAPPSWARRLGAFAAAAALVLIAVVIRTTGGERTGPAGPSGVPLGAALAMSPAGVVDRVSTFTWEYDLRGGETFVVRVFDRDGAEVVPAVERRTARWSPDERARLALPREFTWEVSVRSITGETVAAGRRDVVVLR